MKEAAESAENYITGYVKIYRSLQKKGWYRKSAAIHLWVHLIMEATHTDLEYFWNGNNITLKAGQFVTTRVKLASETGISESQIERWLKVFQNEQQLTQQTNTTSRLITVLNFVPYQNPEQQTNNKQPTGGQRADTKQTHKKNNKILFTDSPFNNPIEFKRALGGWSKDKLRYYYDAAVRYSNEGNRYIDWIAAVKNWAAKDEKQGKLKFKPDEPIKKEEKKSISAAEFYGYEEPK